MASFKGSEQPVGSHQHQHQGTANIDPDCLVDGFLALFQECSHDNSKRKNVSNFVDKYRKPVSELKQKRMKNADFEVKDVIGRGHFGEVRVVKHKSTSNVYAMKVIRKSDLLAQPNNSFYEEERDIMATADNPWITRLHYAFQDSTNLYLVMDFHQGGDLLSLLARHDNILDEEMAKFYLAETAFAINSLHSMGYVHRDVKPENILLDQTGHVKLADFGSAARLDFNKKVSASMPVGTPDYVAPELLTSISKSTRTTYGPEVDWWSLGVCAYEILFGTLPFTTPQMSMVDTYARIMDFKNTLRFPDEADISPAAIDFVKRLLMEPESRLSWEDIQGHPFFSGVVWDDLQNETAAYVPSINGLDDTSNFDDFERITPQPDVESLKPKSDFTGRDLPFVGFTYSRQFESKGCGLSAGLDTNTVFDDKDKEILRLGDLLVKERAYWTEQDSKNISLYQDMKNANNEIMDIERQLQEAKLEEVKANVVYLEADYEKLRTKLLSREQKLAKVEAALVDSEKKLEAQALRINKEKRKSRDSQRKDLILMEVREETWQSLLDEKQAVIDSLKQRLEESENLLEAYQESEEKQAEEVTQLEHKMNTSLLDVRSTITGDVGGKDVDERGGLQVDTIHQTWCPSKKKLVLQVTVQAGRCSFVDNKTVDKLQELQKMVDKYTEMAKAWNVKEEELQSKLANLETENKALVQKEGAGRKTKENLMQKVSTYQAEVQSQRAVIKDLQASMSSYLAKSSHHTETESRLKEMMQTKLNIEKELMSTKEEMSKLRQSALTKTNEIESTIAKLEEERTKAHHFKNRYDCRVAVTEEKVCSFEELLSKETAARQRLERIEAALTTQVETLQGLVDDRTTEVERLEGRNTDIQGHLQMLQQRNSELQVQVEKLQRSCDQSEEQKSSKLALNFQINSLTQAKSDVEHQLTLALRAKQTSEDQLSMADKEKERMKRRIERLEKVEKEKRELEGKMERIPTLERENRRLLTKAEHVNDLEKEKLTLEEKLDNLQMENRREKMNAKTALDEKKEIELSLEELKKKTEEKDGEEVARLKVKLSLLESVENDKAALGNEVEQLNEAIMKLEEARDGMHEEKSNLEAENRKLEEVKSNLEADNKNLEQEKSGLEADNKMLREKIVGGRVSAEQKQSTGETEVLVKALDGLVTRLESSLGVCEASADKLSHDWSQSKTLSCEVDRLKTLVAQLEREKDKGGVKKRNSVEERKKFFDRLQKSEVQTRPDSKATVDKKQVEDLKTTNDDLRKELEKLKQEYKDLEMRFGASQKQVEDLKEKDSGNNSNGLQQELEKLKQEYKDMEIRLGASQFPGGDIPAFLRHELNESNLALSEARSLLSAAKRQELELRERNDKLQRSLDSKAGENATYLQNAKDAMTELKTLMSQHDTLRRQNKVLEEKWSNVQKEKGSKSSETIRLLEEVNSKDKLIAMERKKAETLSQVCGELEQQIKDLEHLVSEADKREAEWDKIKMTYEKAVNEREQDLDGATERIEAMNMARSQTSEKAAILKQQLDQSQAVHAAAMESVTHKLREETVKVDKMALKIEELMERESASNEVMESQSREMEKLNQDKLTIKQELTEALSDSCNYRKENLQLRKHLDNAMQKFEVILGENVSLENFTEALQGLHFLDKYKFESTIGQQMKLIDHLQEMYEANSDKKKKGSKLFGGRSKANGKDLGAFPLMKSSECIRCSSLQDQVEKLKLENTHQAKELLKGKSSNWDPSSHNVKANVVVNMTPSAYQALGGSCGDRGSKVSQATSSTNSLTSVESMASSCSSASSTSSWKQRGKPPSSVKSAKKSKNAFANPPQTPGRTPGRSSQRMHHNIPHRFTTGLNSRATKCGLCLGSVHFVRQASKCQECKMVVHTKCASCVPPNCGLPTEYIRYFAIMTDKMNQDPLGQDYEPDASAAKMEGWLKVPRIGKGGWENRYCVLEGTWLSFYLDDTNSNPVDSFDLDPADADVSVHSAVTKTELTNTAITDLHYIVRLDQDPLTSCWPGRYVYLMTTSFQDKQRWVASLEAVVKAAQCKNNLFQHKSEAVTVLSLKDSEMRDMNCTLTISSQLVLVGTDDGLYAFNPEALTSKTSQMTQLSGFGSVHQMALAKGIDLILILTGPERRLILLENKLVKSRMSRTLGGETTPFSFRTVEGLHECTVFDVGLWNSSSYLMVGTPKKVYLMRYNPSLAMYCVRKEFPCSEPVSCVCIADNYAIIGADRFYKVNMEHPSLLDFVDRQDSSLAFAAYDAANHKSFPLAVVQVSPADLPLEFLLCFHEFGVFVDHHGQRSRAQDVKWSGFPLAFAYVDPFLYVTYFNTVQATVIPTDRSRAKGRQTVMDFPSPRYLGPAFSFGTVYISTSRGSSHMMEVVQIRGKEDYVSEFDTDKENLGSAHGLSPAHVTFNGPVKTPKKQRRVEQLRGQGSFGSLTSLDSNQSSGSGVSVESEV